MTEESRRGYDSIFMKGIHFSCIVGIRERERKHRQRITVDVRLGVDLETAAASDDITHTVDYSVLAKSIREVGKTTRCYLLEALAERIAVVCLEFPKVMRATVTVSKAKRRKPYRRAGITVRRARAL